MRNVTCRRCGNVFGADEMLGVSEVVGCISCHDRLNNNDVRGREQELRTQLVALYSLSDNDYEEINKQAVASGETVHPSLDDAIKRVRTELIELHKVSLGVGYGG